MKIVNKKLKFNTKGSPHFIDITGQIIQSLESSKLKIGNLTVFIVGSTAGITTFEYEPGLVGDITELYEELIPKDRHYHHDETWGDANGYSHLRAALTRPCLTVPFEEGKLLLGTWQQIVLAEFDNRPRARQVMIQIIGE